MSNTKAIDTDTKWVKCPKCGEHEHYYPSGKVMTGGTIVIPEYSIGHCLHCNYDGESNDQ